MDVIAIHTALVAIWPDGIPRDQYVALAGIFKVCGDLEAATRRLGGRDVIGQAQKRKARVKSDTEAAHCFLEQTPPPLPLKDAVAPFVEGLQPREKVATTAPPSEVSEITPPGPRKGVRAFVSEATIDRVFKLLVQSPRSVKGLMRDTKYSNRSVRYALQALREAGRILRVAMMEGPSLYRAIGT